MNRRKYPKAAAVVDIGSSGVKMRIAQVRKGVIEDLDRLEYPLTLGHEVFTEGSIRFESLRDLSRALKGFAGLMTECGVTQYRAVATTAVREAKNRDFVLDQIKVQNRLAVEVLQDGQEKALIYSEILRSLQNSAALDEGDSLISYIGSGSIGIAIYSEGSFQYSQNVPIGALKLHDMLGRVQEQTEDFGGVVEEYLEPLLGYQGFLTDREVHNLILTGHEMELIAGLCGAKEENGLYTIPAKAIKALYQSVCTLTPDKLSLRYSVTENAAELLYSALAIYMRLIRMTAAKRVLCPKVDLWDALMRQLLLPQEREQYLADVRSNAICCTKHIAQRFHCNAAHTEAVRRMASKIFDRTKLLHGMGAHHRLLLELACILHDCGHFVTMDQHPVASYHLIRNLDIYGITKQDVQRIAYITRYNEDATPDFHALEFVAMAPQDVTEIAKLVAIFRLANALDKSQKQKARDMKVRLEPERLTCSATASDEMLLERWAFEQCTPFFKDVFGVDPVLKVKPAPPEA